MQMKNILIVFLFLVSVVSVAAFFIFPLTTSATYKFTNHNSLIRMHTVISSNWIDTSSSSIIFHDSFSVINEGEIERTLILNYEVTKTATSENCLDWENKIKVKITDRNFNEIINSGDPVIIRPGINYFDLILDAAKGSCNQEVLVEIWFQE